MLSQILPVLLFGCILGLNITNKLIVCSFLFILSVLITNLMAKLYHTANAISIAMLCVLGSLALNWYNINILFIGSSAAITISLFCSTNLFNILDKKFALSFPISNLISSAIVTIIDSIIVSIALLNKFQINKVVEICLKDCVFKLSYVSVITICIYAVLYFIEHLRKTNVASKA
ncbi:hypothetical protein ACA350_09080 [Orientia tsutsugamushi]|uniref:Uncharacterized protein n=1 Tax=Orientia tsutsugamushi (strain Ikeda) TaxID=334380 RepID=B3CSI3_ORITI|nr:hypothetical protein OTT_0826 [Orientia tsutsugamushi str. Ikeda]